MFDWQAFARDIIVGGLSGGLSGYIGIKMAIVQLQTWRDIREGDIKALERQVNVLNDDSSIYNQEIGALFERADMKRIPRQPNRW